MYFLSQDGFYSFDGVNPPVDISAKIKNKVYSINVAECEMAESQSYENKKQIWFSIPWLSSTTRDRIFVYDYELDAWTIFGITCTSLGYIPTASPVTLASLTEPYSTYELAIGDATGSEAYMMVIGTSSSFLYKYGSASNDDGVAINGYWTSPWLFFDYPDLNKRIIRITTLVEEEGDYNLVCEVYKDWDSSTYDSTNNISLSGSSPVLERRLDITRHIRALQLKFYTNSTSSPYAIHKIIIEYLLKGRTLVV